MQVTFIDEVNGKLPVTQFHEIESVDDVVIAEQLAASALEYEARVPKAAVTSKLKTNVEVKVALSDVTAKVTL